MDQYSAAELMELYLLAQGLIDTQFQYWMTITFAVVVAAFAAGDRLSRRLRDIALVFHINWIVVGFRLLTFSLGTYAASAFLLRSSAAHSGSE